MLFSKKVVCQSEYVAAAWGGAAGKSGSRALIAPSALSVSSTPPLRHPAKHVFNVPSTTACLDLGAGRSRQHPSHTCSHTIRPGPTTDRYVPLLVVVRPNIGN